MGIYLHIGYPKTATSWFQEKFFPLVQNIRSIDRKTIQRFFLEPGAFEFDEIITKKYFSFDVDENILFSEELLLGRLRPGGVKGFVTKEVANRLKAVFPEATIILFIRNQIDILASAYLQYVRSGGNYNIQKFLFPVDFEIGRSNKLVLLGLDYFLYHYVISYYKQLFGKEHVHVYLYEEFRDNPASFVKVFAQRYNFVYDTQKVDYTLVNSGYRKLLVQSRRFSSIFSRCGPLNKYYILHIPSFDYISRCFHHIANQYPVFGSRVDSKKLIGKHNLERVKNFYMDSNKKLIDEHGLEQIKKYNYPL